MKVKQNDQHIFLGKILFTRNKWKKQLTVERVFQMICQNCQQNESNNSFICKCQWSKKKQLIIVKAAIKN